MQIDMKTGSNKKNIVLLFDFCLALFNVSLLIRCPQKLILKILLIINTANNLSRQKKKFLVVT